MKIWKVYILLTVALLITINQISAQQAPAIAYTEHSCNSVPEQAVSMISLPEHLHVNWFNISIEQSPEIEISFYAPVVVAQQNANTADTRIPVISSNTGNAGYRDKEYFPAAIQQHATITKGLNTRTIDYQKSTERKEVVFRLPITGTIDKMYYQHTSFLAAFDPENNSNRFSSPANSNKPVETPLVDARPPSIPVSIVSIKAALKKAAVQINWKASEEHHLNLYEVERSTDGVNFQTIGLVFPWDNQEASNNYEFRDQHPLPGINYYRLRSINKDSSFSWSVIVPAGNAPLPVNHISIVPNPVKGNIRAVFSRLPHATYNLELRSVSGSLQLKRTISIQQAEQLEILEPGYAPPGIYWLTIFDHSNQKLGSSRVVIR